eukprot:TRINITY_DN5250_c0_g1_i1.p1 TRINITY_DN5250_c0_g1~~TRINITY_DN5250_c0_g1_i1.p1  ORF type:complete len:755 (+),score=174.62 TRINITY_DN5250_c0_g1_i1:478-2742(+)
MYLEWKERIPHAVFMRLFWILSAICGAIKEYNLIIRVLNGEQNPYGVLFISFQIELVLLIVLAVVGASGFNSRVRSLFEPRIDPRILNLKEPDFKFKDLWGLIKYDKLLWGFALCASIGQGAFTTLFLERTSIIFSQLSNVVETGNNKELYGELLIYGIYGTIAAFCSFFTLGAFGVSGMRMIQRLRSQLFESLMIQDMAFFDTTNAGALISYLSGDTDKVGKIRDIVPNIVVPLTQVLTGAYVLISASWKLSFLLIALLVFEFIEATIRSKHVTHKYASRYTKRNRDAADRGTEILSSFTTVRLFVQEQKEKDSYGERISITSKVGQRKEFLESIFEGIETLLHVIIIGLAALYSFVLISDGEMTIEEASIFLLVGVSMITSFQDVIKAAPEFSDASGPASVLMELIHREPAFDCNAGYELGNLVGDITFRNITFKYPNSQTKIFENFSLDIKAGESIAFVGPSGCGKSTLFSILLRFYDVEKGQVLIDGNNDIKDINLKWWYKNVGVVSQEPVLFRGSLRSNILYGLTPEEIDNMDPAYLNQRLDRAIVKSNLESLVAEKGLDFNVGNRGSALSGGQKQRVSIARIFMMDPKVLFFDEVTSALDPISEYNVMQALNNLMEGKTTFLIAHRLHTLTNVDKIFVLKNGEINDFGTHEELVDRDGFYSRMWEKQHNDDTEVEYEHELPKDVSNLLDVLETMEDLPPEVASLLERIRPKKLPSFGTSVPEDYYDSFSSVAGYYSIPNHPHELSGMF